MHSVSFPTTSDTIGKNGSYKLADSWLGTFFEKKKKYKSVIKKALKKSMM